MGVDATPSSSRPRLSILLLIVAANQRVVQLVERELAADGVDGDGYGLLSLVGARGPVSLTAVAAELGMPLTTASDAIRRLESRERVVRLPNPDDGRSVLFALTDDGDREWRRGWAALGRINGLIGEALDEPSVRTTLEELGAVFERALSASGAPSTAPKT